MFIPKGACWLNLQEAWWRLFRKAAFAGQTFADGDEIDLATAVATRQLNAARQALDLEPAPAPAAPLPASFGVPPLRNDALVLLR